MPDPRPDETLDDFMDRCMGDEEALADFPDEQQRAAFCRTTFRRSRDQAQAALQLSASDPMPLEIVAERRDGSGIVRIPILVEAAEIRKAKTSGRGGGKSKVTSANLDEVVANFEVWPGPVPVGMSPHDETLEESAGPMPGFIVAMERRGSAVWAEIDLTSFLMDLVAGQRDFETGVRGFRALRGFSVDLLRTVALADRTLEGAAVAGGIFTNRPALDVHFGEQREAAALVASGGLAGASWQAEAVCAFSLAVPEAAQKEDPAMTKEQLEAKLQEQKTELEQLQGKLQEAEGKAGQVEALEAQVTELKEKLESAGGGGDGGGDLEQLSQTVTTLRGDVAKLTEQLATQGAASKATRIKALAERSIDRGLPATLFDGVADDPLAWAEKRGFSDVEQLEAWVDGIPCDQKPTSAGSGGEGAEDGEVVDDGGTLKLSQKGRAALEKAGLDADAIEQGKAQPEKQSEAA